MTNIYFTQFLRPNGARRPIRIEVPDHIALAADNIIGHGFRFEIEELMGGTVSMTISDDDADYHQKLCPNGPRVPETVDALVSTFNLANAIKMRTRLQTPVVGEDEDDPQA